VPDHPHPRYPQKSASRILFERKTKVLALNLDPIDLIVSSLLGVWVSDKDAGRKEMAFHLKS